MSSTLYFYSIFSLTSLLEFMLLSEFSVYLDGSPGSSKKIRSRLRYEKDGSRMVLVDLNMIQ